MQASWNCSFLYESSHIPSLDPDFDFWQPCITSLHFHSQSLIWDAAGHFPVLSHNLFPEPIKRIISIHTNISTNRCSKAEGTIWQCKWVWVINICLSRVSESVPAVLVSHVKVLRDYIRPCLLLLHSLACFSWLRNCEYVSKICVKTGNINICWWNCFFTLFLQALCNFVSEVGHEPSWAVSSKRNPYMLQGQLDLSEVGIQRPVIQDIIWDRLRSPTPEEIKCSEGPF